MNYITYVIGDWAADGHGNKETYVLASSVDKEAFASLKEQGAQMKGIDLGSLWANNKNIALGPEMRALLDELNVPYISYDGPWPAEPRAHTMMHLIVALVKLADPSVEVHILNDKNNTIQETEGYGLFE